MHSHLPAYDNLHVISDLHMGGKPGFQILRETSRLANYITYLGKQHPDHTLALVLNGDVFDTLAEDGLDKNYIAAENAEVVVNRIITDQAFSPIWEALSAFIHTPNRVLVFVIGNHDIELAFPSVERLIRHRLAKNDSAANGRLEFSTMGAGYRCMVGNAHVYCTHGNEFDAWNFNSYEALAQFGRRLNAGDSLRGLTWQANAGTKLVRDVMNEIKHKYAWIDLLKPETSVALGILLAIDPSQLKKINKLLPVVGKRLEGNLERDSRLSSSEEIEPLQSVVARNYEDVLGVHLRKAVQKMDSADAMLLEADPAFSQTTFGGDQDETLGVGNDVISALLDRLRGLSQEEILRLALKDWLKTDKTFACNHRDELCLSTLAHVGNSVDIVITGHTHLARAIDLEHGRFYFNSGTWIRLLRLTETMLESAASFAPIYAILKNGSMATLDAHSTGANPLIKDLDYTTEVAVVVEEGKVIARLNRVLGDEKVTTQVLKQFRRE